ncbi:MAG: hypothetical protein HRU78_05105 [Gammaproteobacteria bacterium]|nr:MAG: hypothetical protein HRU78_05105 [Gammaproteobacteria bacterium]
MSSNVIFARQYAKLNFGECVSDLEHCKELANAGYYTEAFLAMWILVETISKKIQITYRCSMDAKKISDSLLAGPHMHKIVIEKNNLIIEINDTLFNKVKEIYGNKRESIFENIVISGLMLIEPTADKSQLKYLLASKIGEPPKGLTSKTTIRERRNQVIHNNSKITQDSFNSTINYFDYFFSLTIKAASVTNGTDDMAITANIDPIDT